VCVAAIQRTIGTVHYTVDGHQTLNVIVFWCSTVAGPSQVIQMSFNYLITRWRNRYQQLVPQREIPDKINSS